MGEYRPTELGRRGQGLEGLVIPTTEDFDVLFSALDALEIPTAELRNKQLIFEQMRATLAATRDLSVIEPYQDWITKVTAVFNRLSTALTSGEPKDTIKAIAADLFDYLDNTKDLLRTRRAVAGESTS